MKGYKYEGNIKLQHKALALVQSYDLFLYYLC